jgi:hypothetical protein
MIRRLASALAALTLVLLLAAPVLAGGWAEIVVDAQADTAPPTEGQPITLGFTVLQHGVTPAGWEQPTVHLTDVLTGTTTDLAATARGKDGHFVATVTLPTSGFWTWTVSLRDLASDSIPTALAVRTADGQPPVINEPSTLTARVDALEAAAAQGAEDLPLLAVVTLAVLAGATAGLVMAWLAGRSAPRETVSDPASKPAPSPRGSTPA